MMKTLYLGKWLYTADADGTVIENFAMMTEGEQILWVKKREEADAKEADEVVDLKDAYTWKFESWRRRLFQ